MGNISIYRDESVKEHIRLGNSSTALNFLFNG